MNATDELRRMLDERGVEWRKPAQEYWVLLGMPEGDSATIVGELSIEEATDGTLVAYNLTPAQAVAATLGSETREEVYLLMATDIGDGREEVLGVYATEEAAIAAINENQFGYALHHVRKLEVTS